MLVLGVSLLGVFMRYFKGKRVLVYGMGISGQSACKLLHSYDACVSIYDEDKRFSNLFCFENNPMEKEYDLVVVSPGVKVIGNKIIKHFIDQKVSVISEIDLGYSFLEGKLIAITGTNGKTTVTSLLGDIFKKDGKETFVCGNIGLPLSAIASSTTKKSFTVCEVSNFQLELSKVFNPDIACILNLQEDHIDRHGNFAEYVRVKNKISQNFSKANLLVYNLDDDNCGLVDLTKNTSTFSKQEQKRGSYVKDGEIFFNKTKIMPVSDVPLIGDKNLENVLACVNIAMHCKVKINNLKEAIKDFIPPAHRLEFVGQFNGVEFFNDSKSTNVACVEMAIESLKRKNLILLLGGQNKDCNFAHMFTKGYDIKEVICFGSAGQSIFITAKSYGYNVKKFDKMEDAVISVIKEAKQDDCVLLSPGCASFDEFTSYVARGQLFKEIVCESFKE